MKNKEKRELLLRKFTKEVEQLNFTFPEGYDDMDKGSYICPLCRRIFNIVQLGEQVNSYITIEHVPPENLGGKPIVLTCKSCNSTCGHDLDVYLRNEVEYHERAFFNGSKGHFSKYNHGGVEVNAITNEDKDGIIDIKIERKLNSPVVLDKFCESIKSSADDLRIDGHLILGDHKRNTKLAEVALLKSAYLYAFYKFGYRYILSSNLDAIRMQIQNPSEDILPPHYILFNESYIPKNKPDDIYIFTLDGERVLVVILTLKLSNSNYPHRFAIVLPMPGKEDLELYNRLKNIHTTKGNVEAEYVGIARVE